MHLHEAPGHGEGVHRQHVARLATKFLNFLVLPKDTRSVRINKNFFYYINSNYSGYRRHQSKSYTINCTKKPFFNRYKDFSQKKSLPWELKCFIRSRPLPSQSALNSLNLSLQNGGWGIILLTYRYQFHKHGSFISTIMDYFGCINICREQGRLLH